MDDYLGFTNKGTSIPRGVEATAQDADPSEQSGARLGKPVWRQFVDNEGFQKSAQGAIRAEQDYQRESARTNRVERTPDEKWGGDNGRLFRRVGKTIEEHDPEQFADDPIVGPVARKSLWDRELRTSKRDSEAFSLLQGDPSFKAQAMADKDREEAAMQIEMLPDGDPEKEKARQRIAGDDNYRRTKTELEQKAYDAKARAFALENTHPDDWWEARKAESFGQRKDAVVGDVQQRRASIDAAEQSRVEHEAELRSRLAGGVTGGQADAIQRELAEVVAAGELFAAKRDENEGRLGAVKAEAAAVAKPKKDFFGVADTISGIWDALRGLGDTAPAAFYQLVEGLERPDKYSPAAKAAFAEADAWNEQMAQKTAANQAAGISTSVGESFREAGGSIPFSAASLLAQLPARVAGTVAGAKVGAMIGGAAGAPAAGVGAAPGAAVGAVGGGVAGFIGGEAAGMAAGGAAAYRMAGAMFLNESFKQLDAASLAKNGRPMTEEERAGYYEKLMPIAVNTALWEAGPEAIGNAITLRGLGTIFGFGKKAVAGKIEKTMGKKIAEKATAALRVAGGELGTETATQVEQRADDQKATAIANGEDPNAIKADWTAGGVVEAFKEVAPQTIALMTLMGGAAGGAKMIAKAITPAATPVEQDEAETLAPEVSAAIAAVDVEAAPATPEEIRRAAMLGRHEPDQLAESVLIERELGLVEAEDADALELAQDTLDATMAAGGDAKAAESELEKAKAGHGRAERVRAVLKIAAGARLDDLTAAEVRSLGYKKSGTDFSAMSDTELGAVGLTSPLVSQGSDESIIIHDEALKLVEKTSTRARGRVAMTEAEAIAKANERAAAAAAAAATPAATPTNPNPGAAVVPPAQGAVTNPLHEAGADANLSAVTVSFSNPDGSVHSAGFSTEDAAAKFIAKTRAKMPNSTITAAPIVQTGVNQAAATAAAARLNAKPAAPAATPPATPAPTGNPSNFRLPEALRKSAPRYGYGTNNFTLAFDSDYDKTAYILANDAVKPSAAADKFKSALASAGLGYDAAVSHGNKVKARVKEMAKNATASGELKIPSSAPAAPAPTTTPADNAIREAKKKIAKARLNPELAAAIVESADPADRAITQGSKIVINPERIIAEALKGMTPAKAVQYFERVLDEEIRHLAYNRAALARFNELGGTGDFNVWLEDYYGRMWLDHFAGKKADIVRDLYGPAAFDALTDVQKFMEAVRIMSQGKKTTESAFLWTNIKDELAALIRAALRELKKLAHTPALRAEVDALEAELKKLTPNAKPAKSPSPRPNPPQQSQPAGSPAAGQPATPPGNGGTATPSQPDAPRSDGANPSLVPGQSLEIEDQDGKRWSGTVGNLNGNPVFNGRFQLRFPDGKSKVFVLADVTVIQSDKKPANNAGTVDNTVIESDIVADTPTPEATESDLEKAAKIYSGFHQDRITRESKKGKQKPEYYENQRPEWTPEKVRARVENFLAEIDAKNIASLDGYNNGQFDGFWKLFKWRTGISIPATQKGIDDVLKSYVGEEAYAANEEKKRVAREKRAAESAAKDEEWRMKGLIGRAESVNVDTGNGIINGKEFADQQLAAGWRVQNVSDGPVPRYSFTKDGRYMKNTKGMADVIAYAREAQKSLPDVVDEAAAKDEADFNEKTPEEQAAVESLFKPGGAITPSPAPAAEPTGSLPAEPTSGDGGKVARPRKPNPIDAKVRDLLNERAGSVMARLDEVGIARPPRSLALVLKRSKDKAKLTEREMAIKRSGEDWEDMPTQKDLELAGKNGRIAAAILARIMRQNGLSPDDASKHVGEPIREMWGKLSQELFGIAKGTREHALDPSREWTHEEVAEENGQTVEEMRREAFGHANVETDGAVMLSVGDLEPGMKFELGGEEFTVVSETNGEVVIADGETFGQQTLDPFDSLWGRMTIDDAFQPGEVDSVRKAAEKLVDTEEEIGLVDPDELFRQDSEAGNPQADDRRDEPGPPEENPVGLQDREGGAQGTAEVGNEVGGWQTRNGQLAEAFKRANAELSAATERVREMFREEELSLPAGYQTKRYNGGESGDMVTLQDDNGNDIRFPLTPLEAADEAWSLSGQQGRFDRSQKLQEELGIDELERKAKSASEAWSQNGNHPETERFNREAAERDAQQQKQRESVAKAKRTREANKAPALTLETQTDAEIKAEALTAKQKAEIEKRRNRPLTGSTGDLTADMFGEGDTPLFNEDRSGKKAKAEAARIAKIVTEEPAAPAPVVEEAPAPEIDPEPEVTPTTPAGHEIIENVKGKEWAVTSTESGEVVKIFKSIRDGFMAQSEGSAASSPGIGFQAAQGWADNYFEAQKKLRKTEKTKPAAKTPAAPESNRSKQLERMFGPNFEKVLEEARALWKTEKEWRYNKLNGLRETVATLLLGNFRSSQQMATDMIEGKPTIIDKILAYQPIKESELKALGAYPSFITGLGYDRGERAVYSHPKGEVKVAKPKPPTVPQLLENYFLPGKVIPAYGGGTDTVVSFQPEKDGIPWSVTVKSSDDNRVRTHGTQPSNKELAKAWAERDKSPARIAEDNWPEDEAGQVLDGWKDPDTRADYTTEEIIAALDKDRAHMAKVFSSEDDAAELTARFNAALDKGMVEMGIAKPTAQDTTNKPLPEGVFQDVIDGMDREIDRVESKRDKIQSINDRLNQESANTPGSFITGRSNQHKGLVKRRGALNDRMSNAFTLLQATEEKLKFLKQRRAGYASGEFHGNGQPRANSPSRQESAKAVDSYGDYLRATVKKGDRITFNANPTPGGDVVKSVNRKTITLSTGTAWSFDYFMPWKNGKEMTKAELRDDMKAWRDGESSAAPTGIADLESLMSFAHKLREGSTTASEVKARWEEFKANRDSIQRDVMKMTMKELERFQGMRKPDNKADAVRMAMDALESYFNPTNGLSYGGVIGGSDMNKAKRDAMEKVVAQWTDEIIQQQAKERRDAIEARKKALENPETLDEWKQFVRRKGTTGLTADEVKAFDAVRSPYDLEAKIMARGEKRLTPEQLATYDSLRGIDRKADAQRDAERKAMVRGVKADTDSEIVETKHTKTGADLFVVKLADRVEREVYNSLNVAAKKLGGYYSSFRGSGAVPGFQFKDRATAEQFQAITKGETVDRAEAVQERQADKKSSAAERLTATADRMDAAADISLGRDRKDNTAKRAREAGYAEATARGIKAMAATMRNLAAAIESGEATHLDGVRTKTHVETLQSLTNQAKVESERAEGLTYGQQEDRRGENPTPDQIDKAKYPWPFLNDDSWKWLIENGKNTPGAARDAKRLESHFASKPNGTSNGSYLTGPDIIATVKDLLSKISKQDYTRKTIEGSFESYDRLQVMGLTTLPQLRAALREFLQYRGTKAKADPVKAMERELVGMKLPGFFPTPQTVIEEMLDRAGDLEGKHVLEPSAGKGDIADAAKAAGADVDVIEQQSRLRDILEARGHRVIGQDFMDASPATRGFTFGDVFQNKDNTKGVMRGLGGMGSDRVRLVREDGTEIGKYDRSELEGIEKRGSSSGYDVVLMNPPFEEGQDGEHVQRAYQFLKPGGKLVAITGEGIFGRSDKKSQAFRDWLDSVSGTSEKLPEGSFKSAFRPTGVATRIVVIEKPSAQALRAAPLPETQQNIRNLTIKGRASLDTAMLDEARNQQAAFRGLAGIATSRLANPGDTQRSRDEQDVVDSYYEHSREVQKNADTIKEARRRFAESESGVEEKLLEAGYGNGSVQLDAADHKAAQLLINKRAREAGDDLKKHEAAMVLRMAYRLMRANTARELQIGYDVFQTPEERLLGSLVDAIYEPTLKVKKMAENPNWTGEQRRAFIRRESEARLKAVQEALEAMGMSLAELTSQNDRLKLANSKLMQERLKLRKALDQNVVKMIQAGATAADIKRRLGVKPEEAERINQELRAELREKIAPLLAAGKTMAEIVRILGPGLQAAALPGGTALSQAQMEEEIERILAEGFGLPKTLPTKSMRKKVDDKATMTPEELAVAENKVAQGIVSGWINRYAKSQADTQAWNKNSPKQIEFAKLVKDHLKSPLPDFIARAIAFGATAEQARVLDAEIARERAILAQIKASRKIVSKITKPLAADWSRPEFTDGLASFSFDTKDRAEIMKRVEAIRGIHAANGKIANLAGEKLVKAKAMLAEINTILAKYGTDADGIFKAAQPADTYRFNISDRGQVAAVARAIQAIDADFIDKGIEWVYGCILSGIQTMTVNAGAIIPAGWDMTVGRGFEMAVNSLFRDKMSATPEEVKYIAKALGPVLARAWTNASATWGAELPMFDEDVLGKPVDLDKIFDGKAPRIGVIPGTFGRVVRAPTRILLATDEFNRTLIACSEVGAMAYRTARAMGLTPGTPKFDKFLADEVNTPGSFSFKLAADKASNLIFTTALPGQVNPVTGKKMPIEGIGDMAGAGAAALTKFVQQDTDNLFAKTALALLRVCFFPFQRTPFNIIRKGVRHTLNPISLLVDIPLLVAQNSYTKGTNGKYSWKWNAGGRNPEIITRIAQQAQGGMLLLALVAMAGGEGDEDDLDKPVVITGSQPYTLKGQAQREAQMRSGLGPYRMSFRRKNGTERFGFSYGRLEPLATTLAATIDTLKSVKRTTRAGGDASEAAAAAVGGLAAQTLDKTYMKGLSDFYRLLENLLTSDKELADNRKFQQFLASRAAMAIPNFIKQPIRESDSQFRARSESFMEELLYQVVPFGQKAAKVDPYGRPLEKTGSAAGRIIDVTDSGTDPMNPIDEALLRFRDKHPDKAWFPAPIVNAEWKHRVTGKTQAMTQPQLDEFRTVAGKRVAALLKLRPLNLKNPTEREVETIKETISKARSDAKKILAYKFSITPTKP